MKANTYCLGILGPSWRCYTPIPLGKRYCTSCEKKRASCTELNSNSGVLMVRDGEKGTASPSNGAGLRVQSVTRVCSPTRARLLQSILGPEIVAELVEQAMRDKGVEL